ncbi:unnamed protein product, partial [Adineta steineri]
SLSIEMKPLVTMKNARQEPAEQDRAFFKRWMECKIIKKHHKHSPAKHPNIILRRHGRAWSPSVQQRFEKYCIKK